MKKKQAWSIAASGLFAVRDGLHPECEPAHAKAPNEDDDSLDFEGICVGHCLFKQELWQEEYHQSADEQCPSKKCHQHGKFPVHTL